MKRFARLRRPLGRIVLVAQIVIVFALLVDLYLRWRSPGMHGVDRLGSALAVSFMVLGVIASMLQPSSAGPTIRPPSARWSGTSVVVATGVLAAILVGRGVESPGNWPAAVAILLTTVVAAIVVWRFATAHAAEIGEARFTGPPSTE